MAGERLRRGVLIRHLILPGQVENSLRVLDWIGETFPRGTVLVSLMRQYTPMARVAEMPPFNRRVTQEEYEAVLSWMYLNGLDGFVQEAEAASEKFIPEFLKFNKRMFAFFQKMCYDKRKRGRHYAKDQQQAGGDPPVH